MSLVETIRAAGNGEVLRALGRRFGLSEGETEQAVRALVPRFGHALKRLAASRTGAPAVHAIMEDPRYDRYLDDPAALDGPSAEEDGERALGEIFESGHDRSEAARAAAGTAGLAPETLERLMPILAAITMGALGRERQDAADASPTMPGHFGTEPEDTSGAPLARALAALFGDEEASHRKKP